MKRVFKGLPYNPLSTRFIFPKNLKNQLLKNAYIIANIAVLSIVCFPLFYRYN